MTILQLSPHRVLTYSIAIMGEPILIYSVQLVTKTDHLQSFYDDFSFTK